MSPVADLLLVTVLAVAVPPKALAGPVELKWGIADGSAVVGQLYQMHIPSDAFSGDATSYKVSTTSGKPLPSWLDHDVERNVLHGIPMKKDVGQLEIEVMAKDESSQVSAFFTIFVRELQTLTSGAPLKFHKSTGPEIIRCKREEPETVATIIIDADMEGLEIRKRINLLQRFLSHMDLHQDMVKMVPVGNAPIQDSSALVSGTGDKLDPETSCLSISWAVGCGQVKEGHFSALQRLDDDSSNGKMAQALGHSVIGWRVSNSHMKAPVRRRRQVMATATVALTPVMPTKTKTTDVVTDEPGEKMSREIPVRSSPMVVQPTPTQPPMTKSAEPVTPEPKTTQPTTRKTTEETDAGKVTPKPPVTAECMPKLKSPFTKLQFFVGEVINHVIPLDTFEDCEGGDTRGLTLSLYREVSTTIEDDFFIQFNGKAQKIIGLPSEVDVGRYKMNLIARKAKESLVASHPFTLVVKPTKGKKKINHDVSVAVDLDYDSFISNTQEKINLANKVASVFGDADASNLLINKIARGSVLYSFANKTLLSNACPVDKMKAMVEKLVDSNGELSQNAIDKMKPYVLLSAEAAPAGACEGDLSFPAFKSKPKGTPAPTLEPDTVDKTATPKPTDPIDPSGPSTKNTDMKKEETTTPQVPEEETTTPKVSKGSAGGGDDIMITTIVPAIVIVVILLIALIIACVLYRKKRKGKMNVEEQNTFVNKGAPVIFPDELEDKPNDVNKPLLVEGSHAPPPEYHRGVSESPDPEVPNNHVNTNGPNDDGITEMPERPYDPPPPVATTGNSKQPRPTQQPMSQPPQILP